MFPTTYSQALEILRGGRSPMERPIANNTRLIVRDDMSIAVHLHQTDVAVFQSNQETVKLFTGGWHTVTTKERINQVIHNRVYSHRGQWFYNGVPFYEGMEVNCATGEIVTSDAEQAATQALLVENERRIKAIERYINLWTPERVNQALEDMGGDCWYCLLTANETGKSLGEETDNMEHLLSHMEDGYMPGSLLIRALRAAHWTDVRIGMILNDYASGQPARYWRNDLRRALRNYLRSALVSTDTRARQIQDATHW